MSRCVYNTWGTDVTASAIELLTGAVALLLLPAGQRLDVHRPGRQVLDHHRLVRAVVLVGPVDAARVPVGPVDVLVEHGHGERVDGGADDDLAVTPRQRRALDLLSDGKVGWGGGPRRLLALLALAGISVSMKQRLRLGVLLLLKRSYKLASAQYSLCSS